MNRVRRVLVVHPYGIGDLLFVTPVLRALRLLPGMERVDLLLGSRTECVVRNNPHVDRIYSIDKDLWHARKVSENLKEAWQLGCELRKNHYDLMLDFSLRGEYAFAALAVLGIRRRAGFHYRRRGFFHNVRIAIPEGFSGEHVAETFIRLAEKSGVPVTDRFFEFYPSQEDRQGAARLLGEAFPSGRVPYAVVSAGGGESWGRDAGFKRWPPAFFTRFMNEIRRRTGIESVVIVGSRAERGLGDEIIRGLDFPGFNFSGETTLGETAVILERALFFAGNDGGLLHLASAMHVPVLGWFGPVDPRVYGPYPKMARNIAIFKKDLECRPCYRRFRYRADCSHRDCLQSLTPEEALAQVPQSWLEGAPAAC